MKKSEACRTTLWMLSAGSLGQRPSKQKVIETITRIDNYIKSKELLLKRLKRQIAKGRTEKKKLEEYIEKQNGGV